MAQPTWQEIFELANPGIVEQLEDFSAGYEGVDMGLWEGSKAEQDALRRRGINPKYFRPRLGGAFKDFKFSGDFGEDLKSLNQIYQDAGGENMTGTAKSPQSLAGQDYQRALDSLFQEYPDAPTQSGDFYLNVGIPYFRQGDQTGWSPEGEIGDFSGFHINDDTDSFGNFLGTIGDSPIMDLADRILPGPTVPGAGGFDEGREVPGFSYGDLLSGLGDAFGGGGTFGGPPATPEGGYESIYDPAVEGDIPGVPGMDLPGPGGIWDLIDIDIPGGGSRDDTPVDIGLPEQPEDLPTFPAEPDVPRGTDDPYDPTVEEPPAGPPVEFPGLPDILPPETEELPPPEGGYDPDVESPEGGDSVADWLPGVIEGVGNIAEGEWDWLDRVLGIPGAGTGIGTGGTGIGTGGAGGAGGSVGDINIDFGDLTELLLTLGGGYLGYEESRQDPQYPTMKDLYGDEYQNQMKGLRDQILAMDPSTMVADLPPEMQRAIEELTGLSTGMGRDVSLAQLAQGGLGMGGLEGMGDFTDYLRETGGPQFEYEQGVFDQVMRNMMPGIAGSYVDQTRDIVRNLNESILPGINMEAMGTGNVASSRAGVAEGIATRSAADRMADIESQLIQNAINEANTAAYGAGTENLAAASGTQRDIMGGYRDTATQGLPGYADAFGTASDASTLGLDASKITQGYDQAVLDASRDLLGWQIPLINKTTPAGVGSVGTPYQTPNWMDATLAGMETGGMAGGAMVDFFRDMMSGGRR